MKSKILIAIFISNAACCFGQVSLNKLSLDNGKYSVGFQHYIVVDSTRTYKRMFDWNHKVIPRQIPVSIWYPSIDEPSKNTPLAIIDYMKILKEEEEWEHLPNEQILNWFYYQNTPENQAHLKEKSTAYLHTSATSEKFPTVIYAPSYQASSIENFALCEFLASHGYVIISSPSRGTETRFLEGGTEKDMETQARDLEFLIKEVRTREDIDPNNIATMGFSFGGLSNVLTQMRNRSIKAIVSLDGSIKYQYSTLQKSPFAAIEKVDVPFIHMAQKNIPKGVMIEDDIDTTLNHNFKFYDDLVYSKAYSFKFHNLTHQYFSTLGILFGKRDQRQDKSDSKIMESYKWMTLYTLNFLDAFLKNDKKALIFLDRKPEKNDLPVGLVSKKSKRPNEKEFSFEDFNKMASEQHYKNLNNLYNTILNKHPSFKLEEGKLNNLGLQLVFNPKTSDQGISILLLATKIYSESANLFDSLAEAYLFIDNNKMAIKNFEKSLALNPQNQNAINRLEELKE